MKKKQIVCPFCARKIYKTLSVSKKHFYCKECKLAWIKRFPKSTYDDNYYKGTSTLASKLFSPVATFFYILRNTYSGIQKKKLWVDVGAGDGRYLKLTPSDKKIGVEISVSGREMMKRNGVMTMTEKEFLKVKNLKADVISFWHVLEHMDNPWDYLESARNNIAKDGLLIVGVPNIDSLEFKTFGKYWFHLAPKFHLWHFSPHSLDILLRKTGFKVKSIDHWSVEHHLTGVLQSFINGTAGSDAVLHRFIKRGHDYSFSLKDVFWSLFWLTIGAPIVFIFWIAGALFKKAGTIVVVASLENKRR